MTELSCKNVKGRKQYSCSWCGEVIEKGEVHQSRAYIMDGEFRADREHLECVQAMNTVNWSDWDYSYDYGAQKRGSVEER